jgi:superfamily I DNA/RNA helicase
MSLKPTSEQLKVIAAAKSGKDLVVQALAGTGKTTTLKLLAEALSNKQGTYIAFNKAIVEEAVSKFPKNVKCRTAHSLAYSQVGFQYKERMSNHSRITLREIGEWLGVEKIRYRVGKESFILDEAQVANLAITSVGNFCKSIDSEVKKEHIEIPLLASFDKKQVANFQKTLLPFAIKAWEDIQDHNGFLKFNHDYYLKIWQLSSPKIRGDFILFDEAQDADPVMLSIIEAQHHAQRIYCGDQFQAIYEWRGAENALSKVKVDQSLWLTQSFRFGDAIASEANDILGFLEAPVEVQGLSSIRSSVEPITAPRAILCRTNAGVIQHVMQEIEKNRKVAVVGRTQELIDFAEACRQLQKGRRTSHHELAPFKSWEEAKAYVEKYPEETHEIKTMIDLVDRFGVESLVTALKRVVTESEADVVISTAHKAKGREWETVKLAGDYLHPTDMDTEDLRLAYVSVTRAIKKLDMSEWAQIAPRDFLKEDYSDDESSEAQIGEVLEELLESPRKGLRWSYQEDLSLVTDCIAGKSLSQISKVTGRTITGLEARLGKWFLHASLGSEANELDSATFSGDGWSDEKRAQLISIWEQDISIQEIAEELGVSESRIASEVIKNDLVIFDEEFTAAINAYYGYS